jgi:serine/threonine protein phosphatase PrpC
MDSARVGDLELRAASVIGAGHRCVDPAVVRQDAYALALDRDGTHLVIAVADGVSSAAHADVGARVAVSTAVREIAATLDRDGHAGNVDAQRLFLTVAGEIVGTGRERGMIDRDLCCLLVVAVVPTRPGPDGVVRNVWTAQVGDVSVWTGGEGLQQRTGKLKVGLDRNKVDAVLPFHPEAVTTCVVPVPTGCGVAA